jgi:hypothetical protein
MKIFYASKLPAMVIAEQRSYNPHLQKIWSVDFSMETMQLYKQIHP